MNLLIIWSYNTAVFNDSLRDKLWVYLYLDDSRDADEIYADAIQMKGSLEKSGMQVDFYSKQEAFSILESRLPNVIENFEKYGIDNPLPPTMYVKFRDEQEYWAMKKIINKYEDIIMNLDDLGTEWFTFSEQERRSADVINLTNFLSKFVYFLIAVVLLTVLAFLLYGLRIIFYRFAKQIQVEKLLWADYFQIKKPFLVIWLVALTLAFLLMLLYFSWFFWSLQSYFSSVFQVWAGEYLLPPKYVWRFLLQEYAILICLAWLFSVWYLQRLIQEV